MEYIYTRNTFFFIIHNSFLKILNTIKSRCVEFKLNHSVDEKLLIYEKLSNFLSTQLNTQSSILQLINKINEQGFLDNSTKKIFEDLNISIQELKAKNKK